MRGKRLSPEEVCGKENWDEYVDMMENFFSKAIEDMEDELHDTLLGLCPTDRKEEQWLWECWEDIVQGGLEVWGYFQAN